MCSLDNIGSWLAQWLVGLVILGVVCTSAVEGKEQSKWRWKWILLHGQEIITNMNGKV